MKALRLRRPKMRGEITKGPDGQGRYSFTLFWRVLGDDGHYHPKAQCFFGRLEHYRAHVRQWSDLRSPEEKRQCPLPLS